MSLYANYLLEKTHNQILETERGFLTFCYPDEKTVYIVDLYVLPEFRKSGEATKMADAVVEDSKELGYTKLLGSVVPSAKGSTESVKVLLAYGMKLKSSSTDFIFFEKDI